jgi:purine-binding chemotaxis protein CheW
MSNPAPAQAESPVSTPIPNRSATADPADSAAEQFLTFDIGGQLFGIPILSVQEIRGWDKIAQIPRTPAHVLGVINLRGSVVPVLDIRARLGMNSREVTATTVVVIVRVEVNGQPVTVGCVVDAVSDVAAFPVDRILRAPDTCGTVDSHFVRGVADSGAGLVLVLEIERLIEQGPAISAVA